MKYLFSSLFVVLYFGLTAQFFEPTTGPDMRQYVRGSEVFKVQPDAVQGVHKTSPATLTLPIGKRVLELRQVQIFSSRYQLRTKSQDVPGREDMLFYRGIVRGDSNSLAAVSFIGKDIHALFTYGGQSFRIHPVGVDYRLYKDEDVVQTQFFTCGVTEEYVLPEVQQLQQPAVGNCVEVYFECDFKAYTDNGSSVTNTEAWVAALFNEVATIYENEGIPIVISDIMVWTVSDPYAAITSINAILTKFVEETSENGYDGRLAHLLTTRSVGGGVAFVNVLCSPTLACAVSGSLNTTVVPFPNYSWNVNVISHEMGHNFGSRHTHNCVWNGNNTQIDDCGSEVGDEQPCYDEENPILPEDGTIMSYCHLLFSVGINFNLGFGDQPGALILSKYLTATCTTGICPILAIGIENFELRTQDCAVYLRWEADFPILSESNDASEWQNINLEANDYGYIDYTPSKYYLLQSEGDAKIAINYELCAVPYWVEGSTLFIQTTGDYLITTIDGRVLIDRNLSGGQIRLWTGAWVVTFNGKSQVIFIP